MKTALIQLVEKIDKALNGIDDLTIPKSHKEVGRAMLDIVREEAQELIETEKKQIIDAHFAAVKEIGKRLPATYALLHEYIKGEEHEGGLLYYNETFNQ